MAQTVENILTNALSIASGVLVSPYKELRYVFNPTRNDGRSAAKGYGVRPLDANFIPGVTRYETLSHRFEFVISDVIARGDSDSEALTILKTHYDKLDQVFKQFVNTKMNLSGTVLKVDERSILEPLIEADAVFLQMQFIVLYRQSLS